MPTATLRTETKFQESDFEIFGDQDFAIFEFLRGKIRKCMKGKIQKSRMLEFGLGTLPNNGWQCSAGCQEATTGWIRKLGVPQF